jgi:hypothetical protein
MSKLLPVFCFIGLVASNTHALNRIKASGTLPHTVLLPVLSKPIIDQHSGITRLQAATVGTPLTQTKSQSPSAVTVAGGIASLETRPTQISEAGAYVGFKTAYEHGRHPTSTSPDAIDADLGKAAIGGSPAIALKPSTLTTNARPRLLPGILAGAALALTLPEFAVAGQVGAGLTQPLLRSENHGWLAFGIALAAGALFISGRSIFKRYFYFTSGLPAEALTDEEVQERNAQWKRTYGDLEPY